jgi:hypothetical protein
VEGRTHAERVESFSSRRVREFVSVIVERAISSPSESHDLIAAGEEILHVRGHQSREAERAGGRPSARGRTATAWKGLGGDVGERSSGILVGDDGAVLGYKDLCNIPSRRTTLG